MELPKARGPISAALVAALSGRTPLDAEALAALVADLPATTDLFVDEDFHLALWVTYEVHYRGFDGVSDDWEWHPRLVEVRRSLEERLLAELKFATSEWVHGALHAKGEVADRLFALTEEMPGAPLSSYLQREATREQLLEFLTHKSIYHLKESDPQSFVLPRLTGRPKVALAELQYDEYGAGRPELLHQHLFAQGLEAAGLSAEYGAYLDVVPGTTLLVTNVMNLFALRRSLAAASMGHLGAFEATSSEPCRRIAGGTRRLGFADTVAAYFDEHVEADAVHEQLAFRDICGGIAEQRPEQLADLFLGAAAYLFTEAVAGRAILAAWAEGRTSLLEGPVGDSEDELTGAVAS